MTRNQVRLANPRVKDTTLITASGTSDILFTFDQTGRYVVHDHILMANTGNGVYPNDIVAMLDIT